MKYFKKHTKNSVNYLIASKPPNIGDPIKIAATTTIPKTMPTITNRLFITKIVTAQLKKDWI